MAEERRLETWENATRGRLGVLKFDRFGILKSETVRAGGKFQVTTEERQINSERAATEKLDIFKNGYCTPVRLLEDAEDAKEIASNPNLMGESELKALFKGTQKAFADKLGGITNTNTLRRLLDLTEDENIGASVKHQKLVLQRIEELEAGEAPAYQEIQTIGDDRPVGGFGPTSPR